MGRFHVKRKTYIGLLFLLCVLGAVFRILASFKDLPYLLHPDEPTIVENAVDMIRRHSYIANVFNRPDHFEIKGSVVLYQIYALLFGGGASVPELFEQTPYVFYFLSRIFTAFWGVLMIPLAYMIHEKFWKNTGLISATIVAVHPLFVKYSALATPDIVLSFFVMAIAYLSILYLEKMDFKYVLLICLLTGCGISIKYTCAISCAWIAFLVCFKHLPKKEYKEIFRLGCICALVVIVTVFAIAPNLFTDFRQTVRTLKGEARNYHPGASGLGLFGNMAYYLGVVVTKCKYEFVPFALLGLGYVFFQIFAKKENKFLACGLGMLFYVCTCVLALHWERWGMPFYFFYMLLGSLGVCMIGKIICKIVNRPVKTILQVLYTYLMLVLLMSFVLGDAWQLCENTINDGIVDALEYCQANGIDEESSVSTYYTPFEMNMKKQDVIELDEDGKLIFGEKNDTAEYVIISSTIYERCYDDPVHYANSVEVFDAIDEQCTLIYENTLINPTTNNWAIKSIFCDLRNMIEDFEGSRARIIKIYKI